LEKNIEIEDEIISPVPDVFTIRGKDFIEKLLIHDIVKVADKKQCVLCKEKKTEKKTRYICKQCNVSLCTTCSGFYHKKIIEYLIIKK